MAAFEIVAQRPNEQAPAWVYLVVLGGVLFLVFVGVLLKKLRRAGKIPTPHNYSDRAGNALLEMQTLLEGKKHVIEAKRTNRKQDDESGGPDHVDYFR